MKKLCLILITCIQSGLCALEIQNKSTIPVRIISLTRSLNDGINVIALDERVQTEVLHNRIVSFGDPIVGFRFTHNGKLYDALLNQATSGNIIVQADGSILNSSSIELQQPEIKQGPMNESIEPRMI